MKRQTLSTFFTAFIVVGVYACAASAQSAPVTNADVVAMVKAGLPTSVIVAKIGASPCAFDASTKGLTDLNAAGVPADVLSQVATAHCVLTARESVASILPAASPEVRESMRQEHLKCPACPTVALVGFANGEPMLGGISRNQQNYLDSEERKLAGALVAPVFTKDWEDADFLAVWWEGAQTYSYSYFFPETTRSTTATSGMVGGVPLFANSTTTTTTSVPQVRTRTQIIDHLEMFSLKNGGMVFTTTHVLTILSLRPDKDCLEDAFKFLLEQSSSSP